MVIQLFLNYYLNTAVEVNMSPEIIDSETVRGYIPGFKRFLADEGKKWISERNQKDEFISNNFSKEALAELDEGTLREFIQMLWAFAGWTNKDYLVEEMLKSGLDTIRKSIDFLLHSQESLEKRFDKAKKIRMLGVAGISEILIHSNKNEYAIWNRRARTGLVKLGVPTESLPKIKQIKGSEYTDYCLIVKSVLEVVKRINPDIKDLFDLDFFLYYLAIEAPEVIIEPVDNNDFDHDTAIEQLLELGDGLGFEIEKEFNVAAGCRIDALWRSRIANLGTISYAFEVHRRGSRDSAILNLQRVLRSDSSIQKVILVSLDSELEAFKREIASLGEDFRNAVGYLEVKELEAALEQIGLLKDILRNVGLLSFERITRS